MTKNEKKIVEFANDYFIEIETFLTNQGARTLADYVAKCRGDFFYDVISNLPVQEEEKASREPWPFYDNRKGTFNEPLKSDEWTTTTISGSSPYVATFPARKWDHDTDDDIYYENNSVISGIGGKK